MFAINIVLVLLLLSSMIIIHEFGHWIVARSLGFQTPIFGFGLPFGSHIRLGKWKDTEFRFHWFVLGGYVAIPELGDESQEELLKEIPDLKPLSAFPVWKRALVASAGVAFNIIFAYLVCLIMVATVGPPSTKGNVIITSVLDSSSVAKKAGLEAGDVVLKINHIPVKEPSQLVNIVMANPEKEIVLKIKRIATVKENEKETIFTLTLKPNSEGRIGVGLGLITDGKYDKPSRNPLVWPFQSAKILIDWTVTMLLGLWLMILNMFGFSPAGMPKVNAEDLHGIIAIVSVFAQAISIDFREIFRWTALINVNLAIINLLPVPALDGGHLLFMFIEKLRGKRLAEKVQQKAIQAGFFILILLMFFVIFNDIKGLISGKFDFLKKEKQDVKKD